MKLDGVHHIGVNVRDLDRAEAFYTEVLGFKVIDRYQEEIRHSMLDTGVTKIHLFESTNLEFDTMRTELNRISKTTEYNGIKLLDGSLSSTASNQISIQFGLDSKDD
ncbi:MAG: hypothetical protein CMH74_00480, partial [Nitrospina sp.]|nr:hypothetical protein [Nitrospina sp.]